MNDNPDENTDKINPWFDAGQPEQINTDPIDAAIEEMAHIIAKCRFGPGVDMAGSHWPKVSEIHAAARFIEGWAPILIAAGREAAAKDVLTHSEGMENFAYRAHWKNAARIARGSDT